MRGKGRSGSRRKRAGGAGRSFQPGERFAGARGFGGVVEAFVGDDQIAEDAVGDEAEGERGEEFGAGFLVDLAEDCVEGVGGDGGAAVEGIEVSFADAGEEMAWEPDAVHADAGAGAGEHEDGGERDGEAAAGFEDAVEEGVGGVVIIVHVAGEPLFEAKDGDENIGLEGWAGAWGQAFADEGGGAVEEFEAGFLGGGAVAPMDEAPGEVFEFGEGVDACAAVAESVGAAVEVDAAADFGDGGGDGGGGALGEGVEFGERGGAFGGEARDDEFGGGWVGEQAEERGGVGGGERLGRGRVHGSGGEPTCREAGACQARAVWAVRLTWGWGWA